MNGNRALLSSLADRLALPQPARSRVILEVAADLQDLEAHFLRQGLSPDEARRQAAERLDLSDEAIRDLTRLHGSPLRRWLDRFGEQARHRGERLGLAALLLFLLLGTRALLPTRGLLGDAGPGLWLVAAATIPGLLLAAGKAYRIWGRDEHDPLRARRGVDAILGLAGLAVCLGLGAWWLGLRDVAARAAGAPEEATRWVLAWLSEGSATVVVSFQAAILLGVIWLALDGAAARVERGEAELLLFEGLGTQEGGER